MNALIPPALARPPSGRCWRWAEPRCTWAPPTPTPNRKSQSLVLPSGEQPTTMEELPDVRDQGRRRLLDQAVQGLPACMSRACPTEWIPDGQSASSACGGARCRRARPTAAPTTRSTSPSRSPRASSTARSTSTLPGSSQGFGGTRTATSPSRTSSPTSTATRSRTSSASSTSTAISCRRWPSSCRPTATPATWANSANQRGPPRGRRRPGGAQRRAGRRRLRHAQPRPPRHA